MTITAPRVEAEQGWPDNGPSLLADPWSDNWALPTADDLKAIGWPGARPGLVVDVREVEPEPAVAETAEESADDVSPERTLALVEAEPVDLDEPDQADSPKPQRIHKHRRGLHGLRITVAMVATAYWYFAVATLAIALIVPLATGWNSTTVMSNSMAPTLSEGDVVAFAGHDGSLLDIGTIIQFEDQVREGSTITHRIIGLNPDGTYETKGDANQGPDSVKVATSSVTGVARMISPYAGLPHFWLATGQYVWLAVWILATATAAAVMTPYDSGVRLGAAKVKKRFARLRPVRRGATPAQSEA